MTTTELFERIGKDDVDLAQKFMVNQNTIRRWRIGERAPVRYLRRALCKLAGVTVSDVDWTKPVAAHAAEKG